MAYEEYTGQCIGRVLYFLHKYIPNGADHVQIGGNKVELYGETIASYHWHYSKFGDFETDVPIFNFADDREIAKDNQLNNILDLVKNNWNTYDQMVKDELVRLGTLKTKLPFQRREETQYSLYFDPTNYIFHIFNDVLGEMKFQFFAPEQYQIEREAKFRASVVLHGIHEFKNDLGILTDLQSVLNLSHS